MGGGPKAAVASVSASLVTYLDGSTLTPNGIYTTGGVAYSVPAAFYDPYGDLCYSDGTILYPNGTWASASH